MALRSKIRSWLGIDDRIRDLIRESMAGRSVAQASEVETLRTQVEELSKQVEKLSKKLKMTMGSVQASTAELMGVHSKVDAVGPESKKALQQATIARNTAESTADGLEALEAQIAALSERLVEAPKKSKSSRRRR